MESAYLDGLGHVWLRAVDEEHLRPESPSEYSEWGERSPEAAALPMERWLVELRVPGRPPEVVGEQVFLTYTK
jgi:hypothetical protein